MENFKNLIINFYIKDKNAFFNRNNFICKTDNRTNGKEHIYINVKDKNYRDQIFSKKSKEYNIILNDENNSFITFSVDFCCKLISLCGK